MRLIDADNFIGFMTALEEAGAESVSFDDLRKFIQEQPTAYDVDQVVERIKGLDLGGYNMIEDGKYALVRKSEVLEIVKSAANATNGKIGE